MKKATLLIFLALVLCGLAVWAGYFFKSEEVGTPPVVTSKSCGLAVTSPASNAKVSFPLKVTGTVDNRDREDRGCSWQMFEGQAGTAMLYYKDGLNWKPLGTPTPVTVLDWMTEATTFSISIGNDQMGLAEGTLLKIVFTEEDAAGFGNPDTYELPLIYGGVVYSADTSSWKIYRNEKYTFEMKYPSSWQIRELFPTDEVPYFSVQVYDKSTMKPETDTALDSMTVYFGDRNCSDHNWEANAIFQYREVCIKDDPYARIFASASSDTMKKTVDTIIESTRFSNY